jgi:hypothetical protein
MDIHPPMGRAETLREMAVHILIVTIGILIALGLEGIRESWREHSAVREARESFQAELRLDREQLARDQENVRQVDSQLDEIVANMPQLAKNPPELEKRVLDLHPGFYFFRTTAWESALSSGALTHMRRQELDGFVDAYLGVKNYQEASRGAIPVWIEVETYFPSHHSYRSSEVADGEQKLRKLRMAMQVMKHLGQEMSSGIDEAAKAQ